MTDDASPENLRKFLESDDPAMRRMGLSLAKGSGVPEELSKNVFGLSLWDPEEENREAAAELVEEIGLENITEFPGWLEPFEEEEVDKEVREAATMVLGEICDGRAVEPLIEALGDENGNVRWRATEALGKIGDARAMEPLIGVLSDGAVRESAAGALDELGWKPDTDELKISYMIATEDWKGCVEMGESAVEPLIKALEDDNVYVGRSAAYALRDIGDTRAVEPLIDMLWGDSHHLVPVAAGALGDIGDERAVEPLILGYRSLSSRFPRHYDEIQETFTSVLVDFGEPAVEPLIEALADGRDGVRSYAAEVLKAIGDPRAMEPLAKLLEDPEQFRIEALIEALVNDDEFISNEALEPLVGIGEPAVESLIEWADDLLNCGPYGDNTDEGWGLWQIANALGGIGDARAVEVLIEIMSDDYASDGAASALGKIGEPAMEHLIKALGDEDKSVRWGAAEALGEIGDERAVEPLIKALGDEDEEVRDAAAEALGKIGKPAVEQLIKALGDDYQGAREAAAVALGEIGDVRAVEPLIKALGDEDWKVRWRAAEALGKIGDKRAVEPFIKVLKDEEKYVRSSAAEALGMFGDKQAVEPLVKVLEEDEDCDVREAAAGALDKLGWVPETDGQRAAYLIASMDWESLVEWGEPAVEPLIKALGDRPILVRGSAAEALGKIGDERAVEPLIEALGDGDSAAALALGEIGDEHAVEPLIKALGDDDWDVRQAAAEALGEIGDARAVESLIRALGDEDEDVRSSAAGALGVIGDERAVEPLIKLVGDEDDDVVDAAKEALKKLGHEVE